MRTKPHWGALSVRDFYIVYPRRRSVNHKLALQLKQSVDLRINAQNIKKHITRIMQKPGN